MSTHSLNNKSKPHSIVLSVVHDIDVFTQQRYREVLIEMLNFFVVKRGLNLHAWSIMSDHVNLIISANDGFELEKMISDLKKYTARIILISMQANFTDRIKDRMLCLFKWTGAERGSVENSRFWKEDNQLIELTTNEMTVSKIMSLHNKPVCEGLVWKADQYKYSSAINYDDEKPGLLPVKILPLSFPGMDFGLKKAISVLVAFVSAWFITFNG
jgi:putative transposase